MRFRLLLIRLLALFALAVSTAQLADHIAGAGAFCEFGDTCEQVTASVYGNPMGVPLPVIGCLGFAVLFGLTLVPTRWAIRLVRIFAILAGAVGIGLLAIQLFVLHKVCRLCLLVDSASMAMALVAAVRLPEPKPLSRIGLIGWVVALVATILLPVVLTSVVMGEPVPDAVQAQWVPGEITIVEVSDFDCPHCRKADAVVRHVLSHHKVRFVRIVAPTPGPMHENGPPAARAYYAARDQGKGEEMAAALFALESRTAANCREVAEKIGLNLKDYDASVYDSPYEKEIRYTQDWVRTGNFGVPSIWVQNQYLKGVPSVEAIENAISKAKVR